MTIELAKPPAGASPDVAKPVLPNVPPVANAPGGGLEQPVPGATFTQQDVDRIVAKRAEQVARTQYGDYEELKAAAARLKVLEDAQKTEQQKQVERMATLERERDEALATATDRLIRAAFVAEATKAGAQFPEDVYALADLSGVGIAKDGSVTGVAEAVKAVMTAGRVPVSARTTPPKLDGGAGAGHRPAEKDATLTDEELTIAQRLGITAEKYLARKGELKKTLKEK